MTDYPFLPLTYPSMHAEEGRVDFQPVRLRSEQDYNSKRACDLSENDNVISECDVRKRGDNDLAG